LLGFVASVLLSAVLPMATARSIELKSDTTAGFSTEEAFMTPVTAQTMKPMSYAFLTPAAFAKVSVRVPTALAMDVPCLSGLCMNRGFVSATLDASFTALTLVMRAVAAKALHLSALAVLLMPASMRMAQRHLPSPLAQKLSTVVLRV
jgi:hypothetical protein